MNRSNNDFYETDNMKYGVTGPESVKEASDESIKKSKILREYLESCNFYENEDQAIIRERALGKLDHLLKTFVSEISKARGEIKDCGGKIFTFGSYRLGVHDKGADIDTLCVIPRHVSRKDFFTAFYQKLSEDENVTDLSKVEETYVPVIKLKYFNISIDLTVARVPLATVNDSINLLDEYLLKTMDEKCILSLNGSRVTDTMLNLVPNVTTFHEALRAVKFWAKRRDIYGNTFGYFGGVAFSISVARICQLFPNMSSYDILTKYFEIYSKWKWPLPVLLKPIVDYHINFRNWDPVKNPGDRSHKMPIITPIYPSMCATHNISKSTYNYIIQELTRAREIISNDGNIPDIYKKTSFFKKFSSFIKVTINSIDENSHKSWQGFIESKIRVLATKLEAIVDVEGAVAMPKTFVLNKTTVFFVGVEVLKYKNAKRKIYVDVPTKDFVEFVNEWSEKSSDMKININFIKKSAIKEFLKVYMSQ